VHEVYYNGYTRSTLTGLSLVDAVTAEGITLAAAQFPPTYTWGSTTAHILNPAAGLMNPETIDASVVILFEHGANSFLFTGDIDSSIEATVVTRGTPVAVEVLKVAHHGSPYSSSASFLAPVLPAEAVSNLSWG
jgi:competence protein ComEC